MHVAGEAHQATILRKLARGGACVPLIAAHVAELEAHLLQLDQILHGPLLDLRGIEGVLGMSVDTGLDQMRLQGGIPRIVQRAAGGGRGDGLALRPGENDDADDQRQQSEEANQAVDHRLRVRVLRARSASR